MKEPRKRIWKLLNYVSDEHVMQRNLLQTEN